MADLISNQKIRAFSKLELFAKQVVEGFITGLHKSPFHGFSVEFAEHRHYNPGDSTRHVDWKLYARTDKYFVKRYEEETNLRCQLVIDRSSSMYFPLGEENNKINFAIKSCAALIHLLQSQRDAVGLSFFGEEIDLHLPPKLSGTHMMRVYHELTELQNQVVTKGATKVAKALHEIAERVHQRSLIILFSDMFETNPDSSDLFNALQHLKHNKHEVIVFNVIDQAKELELDFENRPYTFVDLESGDEVKLNPVKAKETFREMAQAHLKEIKLKCAQYGIDFVNANIGESFDQVLKAYLVKRKKIK